MDDQTVSVLNGIVTTAFVGTWVGLAIVGLVISRRMNVAAKRRWMPRLTILTVTLFIFFSTTLIVLESRTWSSLTILFATLPATILISYLNIRFTKSCDKCGVTQYNYNWFTRQRFCSKCGSELDTAKLPRGESLLE